MIKKARAQNTKNLIILNTMNILNFLLVFLLHYILFYYKIRTSGAHNLSKALRAIIITFYIFFKLR